MPAVALVLGDPVSDLALGGQDDTSILQVITDKLNQFINNNLNLIDLFVLFFLALISVPWEDGEKKSRTQKFKVGVIW